jgi:hypothetical protein
MAVVAGALLAGCDMHMPAKDGVVLNDGERERSAQLKAQRDRHLRARMEAGTLGQGQVFPGAEYKDPRLMPRLPPPVSVVRVRAPVPPPETPAEAQAPAQLPWSTSPDATAGRLVMAARSCTYKPVMSDADMEACR